LESDTLNLKCREVLPGSFLLLPNGDTSPMGVSPGFSILFPGGFMQALSPSHISRSFIYQSAEEVIANAMLFLQDTLEREHVFTTADAVRQFLRLRLGRCECEYFG